VPAAHILLSVSLYSIACCAFPSTSNSTQRANALSAAIPALAPALSPASGPLASDCEHNTLRLLGWQQAYSPHGYTIDTQLPSNCSLATWQALGCLKTLTNLSLTGSLPDLLDAWGANDSFPALQAMNFSSASLAGTLPSSWGLDMAFPQLQTMDFSMTQLSGPLPSTWGQRGAFKQLKVLHLSQVNIAGENVCLACTCCTIISMLGSHFSQLSVPANWDMSIPLAHTCRTFFKSSCKYDDRCVFAHMVPSAWGEVGSFPALYYLRLGRSFLNGTLPAHWGSNGTLSGLVDLELANSNVSGTLPQEWGAPDVFKNLSTLSLTNCSISGAY